ncbi:MAG TPA: polysaccharide deacetylase family protein [Phycisphaerae bacterium]|nr:polysaccharide deacetylase family protein [Phycisphaerae bacterium]
MKAFIRYGFARLGQLSGLLALCRLCARRHLLVLCYHRVLPAALRRRYFAPDLAVTPEALADHCQFLARHYYVLPLAPALRAWQDGTSGERPIAAITFDDGYRDNAALAAPVLQQADLRATFFPIVGLVDTFRRPWYDALAQGVIRLYEQNRAHLLTQADGPLTGPGGQRLSFRQSDPAQAARTAVATAKTLDPAGRIRLLENLTSLLGDDLTRASGHDRIMNTSQLKGLMNAGHEIGAHGYSHELLSQLDGENLRRETVTARTELQQRLDAPVESFCYPNGDFNQQTVQVVRHAEYLCAVTSDPTPNRPGCDPHTIGRHFIQQDRLTRPDGTFSPAIMGVQLTGLKDRIIRPKAATAAS